MNSTQKRIFRRLVAVSALVCVVGCTPRKRPKSNSRTFSDHNIGFVADTTANGTYAALFRFMHDTDRDGVVTVRFGDHGELEGDEPTVTLVNMLTNKGTDYLEYLGTNRSRTHLLFRSDQGLVVSTGGAGEPVVFTDYDRGPRTDRCRSPESVDLSNDGGRVVYRTANGFKDVAINDPSDFKDYTVSGVVGLRAGDGFTIVKRVTQDTNGDGQVSAPVALGSCPCWWCLRFAKSAGRYKTAGDRPIWERWVRGRAEQVDETEVLGFGARTAVGDDCKPFGDPTRDRRFLVRCGATWKVYDSKENQIDRIGGNVAIPTPELRVDGRVPVITTQGGSKLMGALRLEGAKLEAGPEFDVAGKPAGSGWWLGSDDSKPFIYQFSANRVTPVASETLKSSGVFLKDDNGRYTVDPVFGKVAKFAFEVESTHRNGCVIDERIRRYPTRGPFEIVCP